MNKLEQRGVLRRHPRINAPLQIGLCGLILTFATPLCCAIFEQRASIAVDAVEPDLQEQIRHALNSRKAILHITSKLFFKSTGGCTQPSSTSITTKGFRRIVPESKEENRQLLI